MPLSPKQAKIVSDGCAACQEWRQYIELLRAVGYKDEAMEARQEAAQRSYDAWREVQSKFDVERRGGK